MNIYNPCYTHKKIEAVDRCETCNKLVCVGCRYVKRTKVVSKGEVSQGGFFSVLPKKQKFVLTLPTDLVLCKKCYSKSKHSNLDYEAQSFTGFFSKLKLVIVFFFIAIVLIMLLKEYFGDGDIDFENMTGDDIIKELEKQ